VTLTGASGDPVGAAASAGKVAAAGQPVTPVAPQVAVPTRGQTPAVTAPGQTPAVTAARAPGQAATAAPGSGRSASGGLRLPWALAAALAGGLALAAAFPPAGIWPLAPAGPALLAAALWRRTLRASLLTGLVFGLAFFVPLLSWLVNLAWYAWWALAVAEALIFAVLAVGQRLLLNLRAWPLAAAGWWVCAEVLRSRWPYAFPWGRLAMSQAGAPTAPWVAVGGAALLSFLLALAGTTLAWVLLGRAPGAAVASPGSLAVAAASPGSLAMAAASPDSPADGGQPAGAGREPAGQDSHGRWMAMRGRTMPLLAFAGVVGLALAGFLLPVDQPVPGGATAVVAAIQGDVPHARNLPDLLRAATVTANHAAATEKLARQVRAGRQPAPQLVIWPENSTDLDPRFYPQIYTSIAAAARAIGRPVLVGAVLNDPLRNTGVLWLPGRGPTTIYAKRQLVPFGEYIPFRGLLSHITSLVALQPQDFTAGHRAVVFRAGRIRLGDVICYEVGFDGLVSSEVKAGANLLAMQTNDATFEVDGQRGETLQQLAMARMRAVESDRAVVVASTTGVSAVIAPDGRVLAHTTTWRQAELDVRVPLLTQLTLADRVGAWPEAVIVLLTLAAFGWAVTGSVRRWLASRRRTDGSRG
jgi:apolipoprotein N-acyltransferase